MFFFPYRVDLALGKIPIVTIVICLLCILTYIRQIQNTNSIEAAAERYCTSSADPHMDRVIQKLGIAQIRSCQDAIFYLHSTRDPEQQIRYMVQDSNVYKRNPLIGFEITRYLQTQYENAARQLPDNLNVRLAYYPDTYNPIHMISSVFAHADIGHIAGNLLFFFAFAASVEIILGSLFYSLVSLVLAIGVGIAYSLSQIGSPYPLPTIGLSGVVMGMIGLCTYLMPNANIRCLFIFFFYIRIWLIPAWILAAWYIGWDAFALFVLHKDTSVNLVAHVSGATLGYLIGAVAFRQKRALIKQHLHRLSR
jgi:membrane associated rhomboid family serine protease